MEETQTPRYALLSCYDKTNLASFANNLFEKGYKIISTGGTYAQLSGNFPPAVENGLLIRVSDLTGFPEILGGRVKTLHPLIHGALLTDWDNPEHQKQAEEHGIPRIEVVVVNLYPFWDVITKVHTEAEAVEMIDIGGVAMLRAAAKNYKHISVYTSIAQYDQRLSRKQLALQAFEVTTKYDQLIASYLREDGPVLHREYRHAWPMKYGCNPHQVPAAVYSIDGRDVPLKVLNGNASYINVLDALGCWGLVKELSEVTGGIAACSFKHTSPAGAAIYVPAEQLDISIRTLLERLYGVDLLHVSPALNAYMRARNADPMSSFGDFIGVSCVVDIGLAQFLKGQISDGIVAPGYSAGALEVLKQKKKGSYVIIQADPTVALDRGTEFREIGGMMLEQPSNSRVITRDDLTNNGGTALPESVVLDMLVATACLKYAQSNNVACAYQGQLVGLSAGQQSRVHSARLACDKADVWKRRHHPAAIAMLEQFSEDSKPQDRINATTSMAEDPQRFLEEYGSMLRNGSEFTVRQLLVPFMVEAFAERKNPFQPSLTMASDAFFPFPDSIHAAHRSGVKYVCQPGGSNRDAEVTAACTEHGMQMVHTGVRIFTH